MTILPILTEKKYSSNFLVIDIPLTERQRLGDNSGSTYLGFLSLPLGDDRRLQL